MTVPRTAAMDHDLGGSHVSIGGLHEAAIRHLWRTIEPPRRKGREADAKLFLIHRKLSGTTSPSETEGVRVKNSDASRRLRELCVFPVF